VSDLTHPGWCTNVLRAAGLREDERVLVVVDEPLTEEGAQLLAAAADGGGRPRLELWAGERPFERPPPAVREGAADADLALCLFQAPRGDEASARFELLELVASRGGRMIGMALVDGELLRGELSQPMPALADAAERLLAQVRGAETVRVRGRAGTDLTLKVEGRAWLTDAGPLEAGTMANYPGGEIFVAPHRDGADGVLVADLTVPYTVDGLVDEPVTLRFEAGRVVSIEGGRAATLLRTLVEEAGDGANVIAELGIGLNPAVSPRGHVMLDEKAGKTAHVAIGRNTGPFGGDNEANIHVDCVFSLPTLEADGRPVELP
jgi:leucyl aminopeptidase (aminopeptidase T)